MGMPDTPLKDIDILSVDELDARINQVNKSIGEISAERDYNLTLMGNPRLSKLEQLTLQHELQQLNNILLSLRVDLSVLQEKKTERLAEVAEQFITNLQKEILQQSEQMTLKEGVRIEESEVIKRQLEQLEQLVKNIKTTSRPFEPLYSVVPSQVKYVDANLAYRFAELQNEANIHLGFTTLFLGTAIASIINIAVYLPMTGQNQTAIVVNIVASAMSIVVTVVFGILTRRTMRNAELARIRIEESAGEIISTHIEPTSEQKEI